MSSKLQLHVRHLNRWWRHLVNAYEVRQAWCLLQVKLCDPCLSALNWFVGSWQLRPTQPSIPPGSVNEYKFRLGRQRQVWFIPLADERGVYR